MNTPVNTPMNIAGAGGGKGGSKGRVAIEAPDSLRSAQYASVIDAISEGEIGGLVDGMKSVFLDGTPVQAPDGSMNFKGVSFVSVNGGQVQQHLPFAPVATSTSVAADVIKATPIIRTISNPEVDWVTVTMGVPSLSSQNTTNGDLSGASVEYKIEVQSSGAGYVEATRSTITGKCVSRYQRDHRVYLTGTAPWNIRVTRLTDDSTTSALQNKTFWDSFTQGIDVKLVYPNTAAVMLRIDSEQFSSPPTRGYDIRGMRVRVPANYDPVTRVYTGSWNGTFKIEWTDNPAWCFFDLLSNKRYGLGDFLSDDQIDKWSLYQIAKYCDESVPNGFGGTEPRFTCNLYLQTQEDAFRVIVSMASIFRGIAFWANNQLSVAQDAPSDPVAIFTAANVIDGTFNYQGADRRARHTVALVSWNDPLDFYKQKIEYVSDDAGIARWGIVQTDIVATGCTSRGQAHRVGKWLLFTEQNESETISFRAGMDAARLAPGDIFVTHDPVRSGSRLGGRVMGGTASSVTIDAPVTFASGQSYELSVLMPDGTICTRMVSNVAGASSTVQLSAPLVTAPQLHAIWVLSTSTAMPEYWRAITVTEADSTMVEINALMHLPGKFDAVELGVKLEPRQISNIPTRPGQVSEVVAATQLFLLNDGSHSTRISLSWKAPLSAVNYRITYRRGSDNFKSLESNSANIDIDNAPAGVYTISISALNALGAAGEAVTVSHTVEASGVSPDVQNLALNPNFAGRELPFKWSPVPGTIAYEVEIRDGGTSALLRQTSVETTEFVYTYAMNVSDGGPRRSLKVRVRAKTLVGTSANWSEAAFANPAPATPQGITTEAGPGQASIAAIRPADQDLSGMIIWMSNVADVAVIDGNVIYKGTDNAFTKVGLDPGIPVYFKVAFYDAFGTTGLNISGSVSVTPEASGGILTVTSLPANPAAASDQLAVYLNVADPAQRGLYGWTGTAWYNVSSLLDDSVTTDKLAPGAVDFAALAIGAVQARNLAVKKHFIY